MLVSLHESSMAAHLAALVTYEATYVFPSAAALCLAGPVRISHLTAADLYPVEAAWQFLTSRHLVYFGATTTLLPV